MVPSSTAYDSSTNVKQPNEKGGRDISTKEILKQPVSTKGFSTSQVTRETQTTVTRYHCTLTRMAAISNTKQGEIASDGKEVGRRDPTLLAGGQHGGDTGGNHSQLLRKLNAELLGDPVDSSLHTHPREQKTGVYKNYNKPHEQP